MSYSVKETRIYLIAIALVILIVGFWFFRPDHFRPDQINSVTANNQSSTSDVHRPRENPVPNQPSQTKTIRTTSIESPLISSVIKRLQSLEADRTTFCREIELDGAVWFEFLIEAPGEDERTEIRKISLEAEGITKDDDGAFVTWSQKLEEDFLFPDKFGHYVATVKIPNHHNQLGSCSIVGIPHGKLSMRGGNAPATSDGSYFNLQPNVVFGLKRLSRFSHLFESLDPEDYERHRNVDNMAN